MKTLRLQDVQGNHAAYELCLPDGMDRWNIQALRAYLAEPLSQAKRAGFMPEPPDRLRHETLCRLVHRTASVFQRPIEFAQNGLLLDALGEIDCSAEHTEVLLERDETASPGNPRALSMAAVNRRAFAGCPTQVIRHVDALFRFPEYAIQTRRGKRVESFAELVEDFAATCDEANQLRVLYRVAEVVHARPFENLSKMLADAPFCSGWEMWGRMERGGGGVCAEKTAAFKFICDVLHVPTFYAAGSRFTIPEDYELGLKRYVMAEGDAPMPVWIQHLLPGFTLGGRDCLVDVSNGNTPLLFLAGEDLRRYLAAGYRARMTYQSERMNLRRVSNWTGDALLTLSEFHLPDLRFQFVFDQALGLHISSTAHMGVFFDYGGARSARYQAHYTALARPLRLPPPRFINEANLASVPDEALRETLATALDALRARYPDPHYTGDFTFVIQPLNRRRVPPRVSRELRQTVARPEGA